MKASFNRYMVLLLCCWYSKGLAGSCLPGQQQPIRCPSKSNCYCQDGTRITYICQNGRWTPQGCGCPALATKMYTVHRMVGDSYPIGTHAFSFGIRLENCVCTMTGWTNANEEGICNIPYYVETTTAPTQSTSTMAPITEVICQLLPGIPFGEIRYESGQPPRVGSIATYQCDNDVTRHTLWCGEHGTWTLSKLTCSCPSLKPLRVLEYQPPRELDGRYMFQTIARVQRIHEKVERYQCTKTGVWTQLDIQTSTIGVGKTTESPTALHHKDERTLVIVSGTTGAILGALIILVVIVSCQRRLHYHRMRRARLRHRQDQDAFTAFITYHRDIRLMLPSYDEAMTQQEQGNPPSFEEALGEHYEEPTLPHGHTPAGEPPSSIPLTPVAAQNSLETESDAVPLFDGQSSASPSEDSRFLRSLRTFFGGRAFRPDAIYCRFVPQEDASESSRERTATEPAQANEESGSSNSIAVEEIDDVLAQAGLC